MPASRPLTDRADAWEDWPRPVRATGTPARSTTHTTAPRRPSPRPTSPRPARALGERARRRRHVRALRRDLLVDVIAAFVLTLLVLIATAGLGVVLLLEIPVAAIVLASWVIEHRRRRRR